MSEGSRTPATKEKKQRGRSTEYRWLEGKTWLFPEDEAQFDALYGKGAFAQAAASPPGRKQTMYELEILRARDLLRRLRLPLPAAYPEIWVEMPVKDPARMHWIPASNEGVPIAAPSPSWQKISPYQLASFKGATTREEEIIPPDSTIATCYAALIGGSAIDLLLERAEELASPQVWAQLQPLLRSAFDCSYQLGQRVSEQALLVRYRRGQSTRKDSRSASRKKALACAQAIWAQYPGRSIKSIVEQIARDHPDIGATETTIRRWLLKADEAGDIDIPAVARRVGRPKKQPL